MKHLESSALSEESKLLATSILSQKGNPKEILESRFRQFYEKELLFYARDFLTPEANEENRAFSKIISFLALADQDFEDKLPIVAEIGAKNKYLARTAFNILSDDKEKLKAPNILVALLEAKQNGNLDEAIFSSLSREVISKNGANGALYDIVQDTLETDKDRSLLSLLAKDPKINPERMMDLYSFKRDTSLSHEQDYLDELDSIRNDEEFDDIFTNDETLKLAFHLVDLYRRDPVLNKKAIKLLGYLNKGDKLKSELENIIEGSEYDPDIVNVFMDKYKTDEDTLISHAHLFMKIAAQNPKFAETYVNYTAVGIRGSGSDDNIQNIFYGYYGATTPDVVSKDGLFDERYQYLMKTALYESKMNIHELVKVAETVTDNLSSDLYLNYDNDDDYDDDDDDDDDERFSQNNTDNNNYSGNAGSASGYIDEDMPEFDKEKTQIFNDFLEMAVNSPLLQKDKKFLSKYMSHLYILSRGSDLPKESMLKIEHLISENADKMSITDYIRFSVDKAIKYEKEYDKENDINDFVTPYEVYDKILNLTKNIIKKAPLTDTEQRKIALSLKKLNANKNDFDIEKHEMLLSKLEKPKNSPLVIYKTQNKKSR
ncbi:MAG: hypothetical protein PHE89_03715 [Alphaproteobacteria bacterium]|nr:hypothetical protein [Alphaproteobacteria bacterium]